MATVQGDKNVWTTENDDNGNETIRISRVSTASANGRPKKRLLMGVAPNLVGVQSKFRRKYFGKVSFAFMLVTILLLLIAVIVLVVYYYKYMGSTCETKDCMRAANNLLQSMDTTVDPCEDFYRFTCGNWAEDHPRPDSDPSIDWFSEKQTKVLRKIRQYLQKNGTDDEPRAIGQARLLYNACLNTTAMDTLGLQPIFDYLTEFNLPPYPRILNITDGQNTTANYQFNWIRTLANLKRTMGSDLMLGFDVFPDPTNQSIYRLAIGSPEPNDQLPFKTQFDKRREKMKHKRQLGVEQDNKKDEEEDEDDDEKEAQKLYAEYMAEVVSALVFNANPKADLTAVIAAVEQVAIKAIKFDNAIYAILDDVSNSTMQSDPENALDDIIYFNVTALQNATDILIAPRTLPIWRTYFTYLFDSFPQSRLDLNTELILTSAVDLEYLQRFVELFVDTPPLIVEFHLWWMVVEQLLPHTTTDLRKLFSDYMHKVTHAEGSTSRSLYCTRGVNRIMGMAVSYAILDQDFMNHSMPRVQQMLGNIRESFNGLVRQVNWMDDGTKCATLEKSMAMRSLIGYPEWLTEEGMLDEYYADVHLNGTTHLRNMVDLLRREMRRTLQYWPNVTKDEWATTPTDVNAFHAFQENAITVPLVILQYPFYDLGIEALNYGAIGTILGHELTHGFDDKGRMYDKNGNMRQWWTNSTILEYVNRTSCFVKQYGSYYMPEVSEYINGEISLGENIADNGGLREAFYAYRLYVKQHGKEQRLPGLENYTNEQLFFMSYGNLWCETQTVRSIKWALEDSHCPGKIRLQGTLANSPEFRDTFNCKPGSGMYPENECRIW